MSECTREWDVWGQVGRGLGGVYKEVRTARSVAKVRWKALYRKSQRPSTGRCCSFFSSSSSSPPSLPAGCRDTHKLLPRQLEFLIRLGKSMHSGGSLNFRIQWGVYSGLAAGMWHVNLY